MAYTLADFSKTAKDPLKKGVIDVFAKESILLDSLSFETAGTLTTKFMRMKTLPTITARNIGENYTESKGITESLEETVCLLGGYIDIPVELLKDKASLVDQEALQTKMFVTAMAYKFNDMFINGSPDDNAKEMVGMKYRLDNDFAAAQTIAGGGLDISTDTATTNWYNQFADLIDQLIHTTAGHSADAIYLNSTAYMRLNSAIRQAGFWSETKDRFGLKVPTWGAGGPAIYDLGLVSPTGTELVITNTESALGVTGGGTATSIYAVKYGDEYLNAWQFADLDVIDIGLLENGVSERTIISWSCGLYMYNPRSVARIVNIQAS